MLKSPESYLVFREAQLPLKRAFKFSLSSTENLSNFEARVLRNLLEDRNWRQDF